MPARLLPLATIFLVVPSLFGGCQAVTETSSGGRAQTLSQTREPNRFAGDWGPGLGYVANDWIVRFTDDGRVSVKGPGMTARGTYVASGRLAQSNYSVRDGGRAAPDLLHGEFSLSADGSELTFTTGIPNDPPVHLRRIQ